MKNIIITGTSRGIGFELAQLFAKNSCNVLALSRNSETLKALNIKNISTLSVDLSKEEDLNQVTAFVSKNWKSVDILINNAGKLISKPFNELTTADFVEVYQVNVFAVATLTQKLLSFLKKGSHVVNISSIGGVQGSMKFPGLAAYSSSKGALLTLTEMLAEEYKEQEIAFNALALGAVQTEMLNEAFPGYKAPVTALEMANYIYNFALTGNKFYNGKILQVSSTTP
ncbi:SDR family oxidoreductase [Lutibacter sp. HS1-25]|uniref:SDR family NAD(P)-dependent oxidoreductase n=1 Tax=Lutibacter sp. HS1-25 TaxID=2485000 RepID=UPI0010113E25|nr:SDR family oxidoreductase [Lutibacter sp. HS1-25]RXP63326.1 SDR family oxidoreductase [Lutibacter sp. HS1-25]